MGQIHASITLVNPFDVEDARRLIIDPEEIRSINVSALVDTGSLFMVINENIQQYLQLPVTGHQRVELANGKVLEGPVVGPLLVRCMGVMAHCGAIVMPDDSEPLLGAIPLEEMNLVIDVNRLELIHSTKLQRI